MKKSPARLNPAFRIIDACGGVDAVVAATGVHFTRVYGWMAPKDGSRRGTGGTIPVKHWPRLMALASERGHDLKAEDFLEEPASVEVAA